MSLTRDVLVWITAHNGILCCMVKSFCPSRVANSSIHQDLLLSLSFHILFQLFHVKRLFNVKLFIWFDKYPIWNINSKDWIRKCTPTIQSFDTIAGTSLKPGSQIDNVFGQTGHDTYWPVPKLLWEYFTVLYSQSSTFSHN